MLWPFLFYDSLSPLFSTLHLDVSAITKAIDTVHPTTHYRPFIIILHDSFNMNTAPQKENEDNFISCSADRGPLYLLNNSASVIYSPVVRRRCKESVFQSEGKWDKRRQSN